MKIQICSVNRIAFLFIVLVGFKIKRLSAKTVNFLLKELRHGFDWPFSMLSVPVHMI